MYGHRARIGYTSPPLTTEVFPYEFYKIVPDGVSLVVTSLAITTRTKEEIDRSEPIYNTKKKGTGKPIINNKRKALDALMASLSSSISGMLEVHKPCLKNGRIFFGRVAGSLVLASPPRNSGELTSAHELALRYCAVPWKSLLVRWCDLSVHTELNTTLSSLWQSRRTGFTGVLTSHIGKCVQRTTHRMNPWDVIESFKEENESEIEEMQLVDDTDTPVIPPELSTSDAAKKEGEMDETEPE